MKKKIILIVVILLILAILVGIYARRDMIPTKLDTMSEFSDVFGLLVPEDCIIEEYSHRYINEGMSYTDICLKLEMDHKYFGQSFNADEVYYDSQVSSDWIKSVNDLLSEGKDIASDVVSHGYCYKTYNYIGIPEIYEFYTTQLVFWYAVEEDGFEYVYLYTSVPRAYSVDLAG